ncbi:jg9575 [Pararge aegeria aegeria]|uniref:Jg9575 protein n=1 Tax=Pararge aegeria aegeria TaxID=348720 RepID=A0A8S4S8H5_9NEOP|nr:jg9575 [Pararge aegeria aegeria]
MLAEDRAWKAVVSFCETVLVKKEAAERDRERANPARRRQRPTETQTNKAISLLYQSALAENMDRLVMIVLGGHFGKPYCFGYVIDYQTPPSPSEHDSYKDTMA